jgi:hypothetical protein
MKYHELDIKQKSTMDELITYKDEYSKLITLYSE